MNDITFTDWFWHLWLIWKIVGGWVTIAIVLLLVGRLINTRERDKFMSQSQTQSARQAALVEKESANTLTPTEKSELVDLRAIAA